MKILTSWIARALAFAFLGVGVVVVTTASTAPSAAADHISGAHCWQSLEMDPNSTGRDYMDFEEYEGGPNTRILQGYGLAFGSNTQCPATSANLKPYQKRVYVPSGYDIRILCDTGYYSIKKATGWHWLTTCSDGYNDWARLKQRGDNYFG